MEPANVERKLTTILSADVAGYSRLMGEDEEGTLVTLGAYRSTIAELVDEHSGRIFGTAGDSVIAEFASPVQAVRCAVAIQRALNRRNTDLPQARRMIRNSNYRPDSFLDLLVIAALLFLTCPSMIRGASFITKLVE